MNKTRRKVIAKMAQSLDEIRETLEYLSMEEDEAYSNLPESIQNSERGDAFCNNVNLLDDVTSELEDIVSRLDEIA